MADEQKETSWKNVAMLGLFCAFIIVLVVILPQNTGNSNENAQIIRITSTGDSQEISNDSPVELSLVGSSNTVKVVEGTPIRKVVIRGNNNIVLLPYGSNPQINDVGVGTTIEYY